MVVPFIYTHPKTKRKMFTINHYLFLKHLESPIASS